MRNVFADPESLPDIASKACFTGFISFGHLAYILAKDESYDDVLLYHWEEYRRANTGIVDAEPPELSDYAERITIWLMLLGHWMGANDPEYPLLKTYMLDSDTGEYMPSRQAEPGHIKLSELEKFFSSYLKIHLPALLFPSQDAVQEEKLNGPTVSTIQPYSFNKKGEFWQIRYGDEYSTVRNLDGIHYIAILLEKPGTSVSCRDLYQTLSGKTPEKIMSEGAAIDEGLNIGSSKQAISDPKARRTCQAKYEELGEALIMEGDIEAREVIEAKMKALLPYMTKKMIPDPNDKKTQANISKRLSNAYAAIGKSGMTELAKHLQTHIKPDGAFGLMYTGSIVWDITIK